MKTTITYTRTITEAAQEASRSNGAKSLEVVRSEEHRAKLREAQAARRERERQERIERGEVQADAAAKRKPGRPKKETSETAVEPPKRPVGRPKKVQAEETEGEQA